MLAVIFLQSAQLQTKESTKPGALVGCVSLGQFESRNLVCWGFPYEEKLDCTAEACSCGGIIVPAANDAFGRQWDVCVAHGGSRESMGMN